MRYMVSLLAGLFCFSVSAQTVINYEDGSTYTLSEKEEIYISTANSPLFQRRLMRNKDTYFLAQKPWSKRDYVPKPTDGLNPGSHSWCKAYEPWSEGYTFDMQTWERHCDTNNDGVYDENDDGWSE